MHHAICDVVGPLFEKRFIFDSYACRTGKGSHRAAARAQSLSRNYPYFLKLDVASFFDSDSSQTQGYHPTYATEQTPYTSPVGIFAANGYGLYDMAGNVWEWCWDWYDGSYYASSPGTNPQGPGERLFRAARGGCWGSSWDADVFYCRVADRRYASPGFVYYDLGFRLARTAP